MSLADCKDVIVTVIDACAIEDVTKSEDFLECFRNKTCLPVFGTKIQMKEFEKRLAELRMEGKNRIIKIFVWIMRSAHAFVDDQEESEDFNFKFEGEKPKKKDIHLFKIAKASTLQLMKECTIDKTMIVTAARDVLRVKSARNGHQITVKVTSVAEFFKRQA